MHNTRSLSSPILARLMVSFLLTAVVAGSWDAWWHGAIGRDTFWDPPHVLLYISVICAILGGAYGWKAFRDAVWKRLALVLLLIIVAAPFDEFWHRLFGPESLSSPVIVWSPPHLALIGSLVAAFVLLLPILEKDDDKQARRLFGAMVFAAILSLLFFVLIPLQPTGPFALLGFWGSGPITFVMVLIYLVGQRWIGGVGATFALALVLLALTVIEFGGTGAPNVVIAPHDHPPLWLTSFSLLLPAIFLDLSQKFPAAARGGAAALICCGLLYGLSSMFFAPEFQFGFPESLQAIGSAVIGGILAGLFIRQTRK